MGTSPLQEESDDSSLEDAMRTMAQNKIRRLPVIDSDKKLVGMLSQADIVKALLKDKAGEMVEAISRD
jgi:CBS domain-containing protein